MPNQPRIPRRLLVLGSLLASVSWGCGEVAPSQTPGTTTAETAQADFDLEATMTELAAVFEERSELLQELIGDPQAFTRSKAELVSQTYYDESRLVTLISGQIQAQPSWTPSICGWYDSTIRAPSRKSGRVWSTAMNSKECGPALAARIYGTDYSEFERECEISAVSKMGRRGIDRFQTEFPISRDQDLTNLGDLYVLCIKLRLIEE